ncbi:AraC family transcriptional regulator [Spirosoma montaniterrae]|uniref:AraC family transcriptional regulator n=1 Tax=Spirosoma montaniterrae TaxID=1178516 RepID=A0A1P9X0P2_9BACT|nr:AraC family transcriptional regulator [Spirosoma montaniterrae]AQG81153.1 AraC family transcriptional regulator [Spirosoma montaniterrae]
MKALFEKVTLREQTSLLVRRFKFPYFDAPWHYHPEYELTFVVKGHGRRFVGDHVEPFSDGDLILIGPDMPHFWRSDDDFYQNDPDVQSEWVVLQFPAAFSQNVLTNLPEASAVLNLLNRARYGLRFSPEASAAVAHQIEGFTNLSGLTQVLSVLQVLDQLAADRDAHLLASEGYQLAPGVAETERMKRVLEFMLAHFREEIRVEQIASVAGMAPAAFCRYFKKRTKKPFVEYLNELRISHARKMLANADVSVGQVGLDCGFNNVSHFHRQFKLHTGMTPLRYQTVSRGK